MKNHKHLINFALNSLTFLAIGLYAAAAIVTPGDSVEQAAAFWMEVLR